jgi:4-hydroxy 2-oxovalerate aldolase
VTYQGNSTFFTETSQIAPFLPENKKNAIYTAFIDFKMYDFSFLEPCDGTSITGIRVGFKKKDFDQDKEELKRSLMEVKQKGYRLLIQGVNTPAYSDRELLDVLDFVNEIEPYSYGIVDTYGSMYLEDITHYYNLVDRNLNRDIHIDIHSHNNFQLSFAFAQEIIRLAEGRRNIILDATLNGMGKCAGNLNTELIVEFLVRTRNYDYDIDTILDTIDRDLYAVKENHPWGYSIPAFMAGLYKAHPNNIIYLTEKYRLSSKDIKYIVSGIDEKVRQRYDYDNIQRVYREYNACRTDDTKIIERLTKIFEGKNVLVLAPGQSVVTCKGQIRDYIQSNNVLVVSVNFIPEDLRCDYFFCASMRYWKMIRTQVDKERCIVTSNIHDEMDEGINLVDYASLIEEESFLYDNSTIMLLNLLKKLQVVRIALAGFDGLKVNATNYVSGAFPTKRNTEEFPKINKEIKHLLEQYRSRTEGKVEVHFLTPSLYERDGI